MGVELLVVRSRWVGPCGAAHSGREREGSGLQGARDVGSERDANFLQKPLAGTSCDEKRTTRELASLVESALVISTRSNYEILELTGDIHSMLALSRTRISGKVIRTKFLCWEARDCCSWNGITCDGATGHVIGLDLSYLHIYGQVDFESIFRLQSLDLANNSFSGPIPEQMGQLFRLRFLRLHNNTLTGKIPTNLTHCSKLEFLYLRRNQLSGRIPTEIGSLSKLTELDLGENNLTGSIPLSLGNLSSLSFLFLSRNNLDGSISDDLGRLASFELFGISQNELTGRIPPQLYNLSSIYILDCPPRCTIPAGVGRLNKIAKLYLSGNELSGQIPYSSFGNFTSLYILDLSENNLSGSIPSTIGNCINLQFIYLQNNHFSSSLPKQLFSLPSLIDLFVQNNSFTGYLTPKVSYLKALGRFIVSNNKLSGEIPSWLGNCLSLEFLLLDGNLFQGLIPPIFSALRGLRFLDLSHNNFSGKIPEYLEKLLVLQYLDLSFNNLEGELPKRGVFGNASRVSVLGNSKLCGGIEEFQLPACPSQASKKQGMSLASKVKISIIGAVLCLISLSCFLTTLYWVRKSRRKPFSVPSVEDPFMNISYAELFKATNGFSSANLIGTGSFGSVYKGTVDQDGTVMAVKVLNLQQQGALRSFIAECEALRNIKHRNLIKILTCCSSIDFKGNEFKALVFEYMSNGSLDKWLHRDGQDQLKRNLNFIQRLNVAIDVASSLDYLHHHCPTPILHRDLKPSNILLDSDMTAHVGDFGLARFLSEVAQTSSVGVKGSMGYIAPEYAMGSKASTQGDVYSYGILLLEMIMGKMPTDDMFKDNLSLHHFAKSALSEEVMEIVDPFLFEEAAATQGNQNHINVMNRMRDCWISMVRIGVLCSTGSPKQRMKMKEVAMEMHAIEDLHLGEKIH
ncbi:putative receptor-like protein kinase At3g47110 [Magnolia sinica]|uniref:putative receptor-like protein kinase At3g47110 n=1 Tax=Magnolia sinica TaxID=86752 RepID=UPI00265AD5A9|nr:putative receptor-like protein kinase At3g47110 [Magnolia sinica]